MVIDAPSFVNGVFSALISDNQQSADTERISANAHFTTWFKAINLKSDIKS
jgi:hypothetical protein